MDVKLPCARTHLSLPWIKEESKKMEELGGNGGVEFLGMRRRRGSDFSRVGRGWEEFRVHLLFIGKFFRKTQFGPSSL